LSSKSSTEFGLNRPAWSRRWHNLERRFIKN